MYLEEYAVNHSIGRFVLGSSVFVSIAASGLMTILARRFAIPKVLSRLAGDSYSDTKLSSLFSRLCEKMGIANVELRQAKIGNAFSISIRGRRLVAVSPFLVGSLSPEEAEGVLAHELSHLRGHDSLVKGLARFARFAFPFDPVIRVVEAAVHRESEFLADISAARSTQRPLALASALIKAHSTSVSATQRIGAGLFVGGTSRGWLSLYPKLERRIDLLLKLADAMKIVQEIPA